MFGENILPSLPDWGVKLKLQNPRALGEEISELTKTKDSKKIIDNVGAFRTLGLI